MKMCMAGKMTNSIPPEEGILNSVEAISWWWNPFHLQRKKSKSAQKNNLCLEELQSMRIDGQEQKAC